MSENDAIENPYQPPQNDSELVPNVAPRLRVLPFALMMGLATVVAICLLEGFVFPTLFIPCLLGPPLISFYTQEGKWRVGGAVLCATYLGVFMFIYEEIMRLR